MPDPTPDYHAFLAQHLPGQREPLASHLLPGGRVWLRRCSPPAHPLRTRLLALVARLSNCPALQPQPGADAAAEIRQLEVLIAHGLCVPTLLASNAQGWLMADPQGSDGASTPLDAALHHAADHSGGAALALWRQGLALLDALHAAGLSLGGALASDLLLRTDGLPACTHIDTGATRALSPELCQVRDALAWLWSTAGILHQAGLREAARAPWNAWVANPVRGDAFRAALARHLARLSWLRYLPPDTRWGRNLYRMRAAYELAVPPRYGDTSQPDPTPRTAPPKENP